VNAARRSLAAALGILLAVPAAAAGPSGTFRWAVARADGPVRSSAAPEGSAPARASKRRSWLVAGIAAAVLVAAVVVAAHSGGDGDGSGSGGGGGY
jgi:hypothetical protein